MSTVRYAEICYPGIFFPETSTVKVTQKTTAKELFKKYGKDGAYRIEFFTRTEEKRGDEVLKGKHKPEKGHFLYGQGYTLAEMKAKKPALDSTLISNVECNKWKGAVRCKPGNWQPWDEDTTIIEVKQ